jgi:TnpA family transposase
VPLTRFTEHVFALCHFLGFRFAPRIRDLADRRLYTAEKAKRYPTLQPFIGGTINLKQLLPSGQRSCGLVAPSAWAR